ncbi:uncharacterized protein K489DRAFT_58914 [Dissoconium aciculare CBS 342.82]|uniref:Uncharacterized protein n=1 Tax=Dissoconium aciculare CBS 342.82 TaxID=1314786 RepID=A0A6J3LVL1_9PEZI|nr:uncharacterized protein K489DRAFT_58914 [Dissoconium aciculare CBS 342.82]KAF1819796.1 hypothetical protein K489DRAFT_58914 [Dissoconium aciculare CBS 342.82]
MPTSLCAAAAAAAEARGPATNCSGLIPTSSSSSSVSSSTTCNCTRWCVAWSPAGQVRAQLNRASFTCTLVNLA